jgi:hypothetical protein
LARLAAAAARSCFVDLLRPIVFTHRTQMSTRNCIAHCMQHVTLLVEHD